MANKNNALTKSLYPTKTVINFINQDKEKEGWGRALVFFVAALILAAFWYFGIFIPMRKVHDAELKYNDLSAQYSLLLERNADYSSVQEEYNVRLNRFMDEDEISCDNHAEMLAIVFDNMVNGIDVESIRVDGNELEIVVNDATLSSISDYLDNLNGDPRVGNADVVTSAEDLSDESSGLITARISVLWNSDYVISSEGGEA